MNMEAASLERLISRLENVTTRLEALTGGAGNLAGTVEVKESSVEPDKIADDINRVREAIEDHMVQEHRSEKGASVTAFDSIYNDKVASYTQLSAKIGGEVAEQAVLVKNGFDALRVLLVTAEGAAKPSDADLPNYVKPIGDCVGAVTEYRDKQRKSAFFNHLSTVSETIGALGWVCVSPTPGPYVKELKDAGQFYGNRVLKDYKDKDQQHVDWVKAFQAIWTDLGAYIKQHHTTGLTWNAKGGSAAPPPPPPGGAPPPPPPVAAPTGRIPTSGSDAGASRNALLDSLNKGASVTSGLKKVTNDMKTHKNPALRAGSSVPASGAGHKPAPSSVYVPKPFQASSKPAVVKHVVAPKKPPVLALEGGKKWVVENHEKNRNIVIDKTSIKQSVYIYNCKESTITIKGKVNTVTLDSCKKTAIVVDDLIAALEFVNCQSVQSQIHGEAPLVSIDKTDGIQVYLSAKSKTAAIVSAKSSEMNILVPGDGGEFTEHPLPEQYKSVWNGKGFVTTPTDI